MPVTSSTFNLGQATEIYFDSQVLARLLDLKLSGTQVPETEVTQLEFEFSNLISSQERQEKTLSDSECS